MSLFKKPNRKFRQRSTKRDSDDDENERGSKLNERISNETLDCSKEAVILDNISIAPLPKCEKEQDFDASVKLNPKLSFHDDGEEEDEDVFQVRKSSYSRRLVKRMEKEKRREEREAKKELLRERKLNRLKLEDTDISVRKKMEREELSINWVNSKPIKHETLNSEEKFSEEDLKNFIKLEEDDDEEEEEDEGDNLDRKSNYDHQFKGFLDPDVIPDAKTIFALKKQRQMARDIEEFIPLTSSDTKQDSINKSRLVRGDDDDDDKGEDDDEDDEDDEIIKFNENKEATERERNKEAFINAQEEEDNDMVNSEDELERWEEEQIRKGVGSQSQAQLISQAQLESHFIHSGTLNTNQASIIAERFKKKSKVIPGHLMKYKTRSSPTDIVKRLQNFLEMKKENLESLERQLITIGSAMEQTEESIENLKNDIKSETS